MRLFTQLSNFLQLLETRSSRDFMAKMHGIGTDCCSNRTALIHRLLSESRQVLPALQALDWQSGHLAKRD